MRSVVWFGWCTHEALAFKNLVEWGMFSNSASCRALCNERPDVYRGNL